MGIVEILHGRVVHPRRSAALARHLSPLFSPQTSVLDVGCGDGAVAAAVMASRPDIQIVGIDVLPRRGTHIPVQAFDGVAIPFSDASFDAVLFVDVLHHALDPFALLAEGVRVARRAIVIKDHTRDGFLAGPTLRVMDWTGNARHGVALPYNYWTSDDWQRAVTRLRLSAAMWKTDLALYPKWLGWMFERSLHFLAVLTKT